MQIKSVRNRIHNAYSIGRLILKMLWWSKSKPLTHFSACAHFPTAIPEMIECVERTQNPIGARPHTTNPQIVTTFLYLKRSHTLTHPYIYITTTHESSWRDIYIYIYILYTIKRLAWPRRHFYSTCDVFAFAARQDTVKSTRRRGWDGVTIHTTTTTSVLGSLRDSELVYFTKRLNRLRPMFLFALDWRGRNRELFTASLHAYAHNIHCIAHIHYQSRKVSSSPTTHSPYKRINNSQRQQQPIHAAPHFEVNKYRAPSLGAPLVLSHIVSLPREYYIYIYIYSIVMHCREYGYNCVWVCALTHNTINGTVMNKLITLTRRKASFVVRVDVGS